ncbi:MAG TPA: chemotaxis protein CheW [Gallionella sp.]|nr:chemotaxis protein CheW [Gallionella sp.]
MHATHEQRFLLFTAQDMRLCAKLEHCVKILPLMALQALPGGPPHLVGLMNLHGEGIPVVDIAACMDLERRRRYDLNTCILLCESGGKRGGLIVDDVLGIAAVRESVPQMESLFHEALPLFSAAIPAKGGLSLELDLEHVLDIDLASLAVGQPLDAATH